MLARDSPDVINHPQFITIFLGWVSTFLAHWVSPTLVVLATGPEAQPVDAVTYSVKIYGAPAPRTWVFVCFLLIAQPLFP
jgi:hypothetical protein